MTRPILVFALILWPASLFADPYVMIEQDGAKWSGTLIGFAPSTRGLYLTCKHGYDPKKPVSLVLNGSVHGEGRIVAVSKESDLMLIEGTAPSQVPPLRIAADSPETGDKVLMAGHPKNHTVRKTTVVKETAWLDVGDGKHWSVSQTETKRSQRCLVLEGSSQPGFSGGAVVHEGKLAGVIVGSSDKEGDAWAIPAESIVWFLRQNEKLFDRKVVP